MGKCKDCGADLGGSASMKDYRDHYKVCPARKDKVKEEVGKDDNKRE